MTWILGELVCAAVLHACEEYWLPGGFIHSMREAAPRFAEWATPTFAVVINGLNLVLLVGAALISTHVPVLSLSAAALCFCNVGMHGGGGITKRSHTPGLVTAVALYLPISILAYVSFIVTVT